MKNSTILLLLFCCYSCLAQKIHFGDTSNVWRYRYTEWFTPKIKSNYQFEVVFGKDTLISGLPFHQMEVNYAGHSTNGYIYDDTIKNIVYVNDTTTILYDFNRKINDSFTTLHNGYTLHHVVSNTYVTFINGIQYKVFEFKVSGGPNWFSTYTIIEGIGSIRGPLFPYYVNPGLLEITDDSLICFENKTSRPSIDAKFGINLPASKCFGAVGISKEPSVVESVSIYPQPAHESVTLKLPTNINSASIELFNTVGQKVFVRTFEKQQHQLIINNDGWRGLYLYRIINKGNETTYTGKIIFQ